MDDNKVIKPAPWNEKPGLQEKLDIDESAGVFDDWDANTIPFDDENRENDMIFDYKAARTNAHFCVHAATKILGMIAQEIQYSRNPVVADACVKLVKTISDNNRDLIKLHTDFKTTQLLGKPKAGEAEPDATPETEGERVATVKSTVSEIVAAAKEEKNVK